MHTLKTIFHTDNKFLIGLLTSTEILGTKHYWTSLLIHTQKRFFYKILPQFQLQLKCQHYHSNIPAILRKIYGK